MEVNVDEYSFKNFLCSTADMFETGSGGVDLAAHRYLARAVGS